MLFGMLNRRERWGLSGRGWLVLIAALGIGVGGSDGDGVSIFGGNGKSAG